MRIVQGSFVLSATDLSNHLACRHLTTLDYEVAQGERSTPDFFDPRLASLRDRGLKHERAYLSHLREQGIDLIELPETGSAEEILRATLDAMRGGAGAISQATLADECWNGRADVLLRVDRPSDFGDWSYEPVDTKLAEQTRGGTVLQLIVYAELLRKLQGVLPESVAVVTPSSAFKPETYRVAEYHAFAARVRQRLEESLRVPSRQASTYPLPTVHCDVCRWWSECDARWRQDDHPCLVAGVRRSHLRELASWRIDTLSEFAGLPLPLSRTPDRGSKETFTRLREQARVQLESRQKGGPVWECLPAKKDQGLARLPEPSRGDVFLDFEGDPFVGEGGLEYLIGVVTVDGGAPEYRQRWAFGREEERAAFESLMDELTERWERYPDFHVYHFGVYEPGALKRLMGRYASREDALDRLLRSERFVDLHRVVTQGLLVGVESYSLKKLEPVYGFEREKPLDEAARALREIEGALELERVGDIGPELREEVAGYNRDDCVSTLRLRDWLETVRAGALAAGDDLPRPAATTGEAPETLTEWQNRVRPVMQALLGGLPANPEEFDGEQRARWLLAHCLEFHRREDKVNWWEYFRLARLSEDERYNEPRAIADLTFDHRIQPEGKKKAVVDVYSFPPQELDRRSHEVWAAKDHQLGTIDFFDDGQGWVGIKKKMGEEDVHPSSVFLHGRVEKDVLEESLLRFAQWVAAHSMDEDGDHRAERDLLLRTSPRGCSSEGGNLAQSGENTVACACRMVMELDRGVLPIQGPPGAGKTYTGARMIVALARQGRKIGVTALSHKVIRKLLEESVAAADEEGLALNCLQKITGSEADGESRIQYTRDNKKVLSALVKGEVQVAAGTAWLWARPELKEAVDVLFVDEAGQMSLADVLAAGQAARSLVLLGDPQQLEQPIQGSHPDGTAMAALTHLLNGRPTLGPESGLFLEWTWRLHPEICAFTSEQFYEGRLRSLESLENLGFHAASPFDQCGLFFLPVEHEGNQNDSEEEAEEVCNLVRSWLASGAEWTDPKGVRARLTADDVLVVVPYNAQIRRLQRLLPEIKIGTVDKFQGQQAAVVIYSMVTSSPEEAPRGMEFLYSRNRLNVATSRARCACVLVASPRLLEPECRTPGHLRLANALCRYVEMAVRLA